MLGNLHARFGGGPTKKDHFWHLVGGLPYVTPLAGDHRDPEVYRELLAIVERHAPDVL